jgi:uncharacterized phage protein (TIGR01671 family)
MSREILFRGKRVDTGEWAYGRLIAVSSMALGEVIEAIQEMSIDGKMCSSKIVNPATIGQYTGLKDVNGVKIFEGDLVMDTKPCVVEYSDMECNFMLINSCMFHDYLAGFNGAVIGNIHN